MNWRTFDYFAMGFNLVLAINLVVIFFLASFNGGSVQVLSNKFGEQGVETVLFPVIIVMGFVTLIRLAIRS